MSLLEVEGLRAAYGQVRVLEGIDFSVDAGQQVAMLGPNGAGKTTMLRALSGMVRTSGRREFDGRSLVGHGHRRRSRGAASRTCPRAAARSPR